MALNTRCASVISAGLWLLTFSPAFSQQSAADAPQNQAADIDPARLDASREFMLAAQMEKDSAHGVSRLINRFSDKIMPILSEALPKEKRSEEVPKLFKQSRTEIEKVVANRFREWKDRVAMAYARSMTVEQLTAVSEFYRSSVGPKFMKASPVNITGLGFLIIDWLMGRPAEIPGNVDPAVIIAARETIRISKSDKLLDVLLVMMSGPPDGIPVEAEPEVLDALRINLSRREEMLDFMAAIWARRFTIEELRIVTAFYSTPIGASVGDAIPSINREQIKITTAFYKESSADLTAWTQEMLKTLGSGP